MSGDNLLVNSLRLISKKIDDDIVKRFEDIECISRDGETWFRAKSISILLDISMKNIGKMVGSRYKTFDKRKYINCETILFYVLLGEESYYSTILRKIIVMMITEVSTKGCITKGEIHKHMSIKYADIIENIDRQYIERVEELKKKNNDLVKENIISNEKINKYHDKISDQMDQIDMLEKEKEYNENGKKMIEEFEEDTVRKIYDNIITKKTKYIYVCDYGDYIKIKTKLEQEDDYIKVYGFSMVKTVMNKFYEDYNINKSRKIEGYSKEEIANIIQSYSEYKNVLPHY